MWFQQFLTVPRVASRRLQKPRRSICDRSDKDFTEDNWRLDGMFNKDVPSSILSLGWDWVSRGTCTLGLRHLVCVYYIHDYIDAQCAHVYTKNHKNISMCNYRHISIFMYIYIYMYIIIYILYCIIYIYMWRCMYIHICGDVCIYIYMMISCEGNSSQGQKISPLVSAAC